MKNFKKECKSFISIVLVIMLMFTMLVGTVGISASADAAALPEVINEPTLSFSCLSYSDLQYLYGSSLTDSRDSYYSGNYFSLINLNSVNLVFDCAESDKSLNDIASISYTYVDENLGVSGQRENLNFSKVTDFDTVLVQIGWKNIYQSITGANSFYYYTEYCSFIDSLRRSELSLTITYSDGSVSEPIAVNMIEVNNGQNSDSGYYSVNSNTEVLNYNGTASCVLISLAHCKDIDFNSILEMDNAIVEMQSKETTNKYYVNTESKNDIILPMDNMSSKVNLVQTRVGSDIVYNTEQSADFNENAVEAVSDGQISDYGKMYELDGVLMKEDNLYYLAQAMYKKGIYYAMISDEEDNTTGVNPDNLVALNSSLYNYYYGDYNYNYYNVFYAPSSFNKSGNNETALKLLNNGVIVDVPYSNLAGEEVTSHLPNEWGYEYRIVLDENSDTIKNQSIYDAIYNLRNGPFDTNIGRATIMDERAENGEFYQDPRIYIYYSYGYGDNCDQNSSMSSSLTSYNNSDYIYRYLTNQSSYYPAYRLDSVYITLNSKNDEAFNKILEVLDNYNVDYDVSASYYPVFEEAKKTTSLRDYMGVTETEGILGDSIPNFGRYSGYSKGDRYSINNTFIDNANITKNRTEIITDTYDSEGNIKFPQSMLNSCEKGVAYNIVNQILLYSMLNEYGDGYMDLGAVNDDGAWAHNGNVYYMDGELIRSALTSWSDVSSYCSPIDDYFWTTDHKTNAHSGNMRYSEYKWGELVLASRPDSVSNLEFKTLDKEKDLYMLSWSKPVDEGMGFTSASDGSKTSRYDDYVYLKGFTVTITDEGGKEAYKTDIKYIRDASDNICIKIPASAIEKGKNYTATVIANNAMGSSDAVETDIYVSSTSVSITMTPDQPYYRDNSVVTYTETVTNTGDVKLTNVKVTQTAFGEYDMQPEMTVKGTNVMLPNLDAGESYTFTYRVPTSDTADSEVVNTAKVTTAEKASDETKSTVFIIHPALSLTKTADKDQYLEHETVAYTNVIQNTGDFILKNVTVTEDSEKGKFHIETADTAEKKIELTKSNVAVIDELKPGESVTLSYEINSMDVADDENGNVQSLTSVTVPSMEDITAKAMAEYKILHPTVEVTSLAEKELYGDLENISYTDTITNTGVYVLHNLVVSQKLENGSYAENSKGSVNENGDFVIDELLPGESISLTYTVNAENIEATDGIAENTVTVTCKENASDTAGVSVQIVHYELLVTKLVDSSSHAIGDKTVFTGIIKNTGNYTLTNIEVKEDLNGEIILSEGASIVNDVIVIAELKPNESYSYNLVVKYSEDLLRDGILTSTVSAKAGESVQVNGRETVIAEDTNFTKYYKPSISVKKSADKEQAMIGDTVTYTDTITNNGECDLTNIVVTESVDGTFVTDYESNEKSVIIPNLAVGETAEITFIAAIESDKVANGVYNCTVKAVSDEKASAGDTSNVRIVNSGISITKMADKDIYEADEIITYVDTITNTGDVVLTNVVVTENLDGEFTEYSDKCTPNGNKLTISEIGTGESIAVRYSVKVSDAVTTDDTVTSSVTVQAKENASASDTLTVNVIASSETDSETDIETNTDSTDDTSTDTETDSGTDTESDTDTSTDSDTETDSDTDSSSDTDSDTDDSDTDTEVITYIVGDVSGDGRVTVADAIDAQKASLDIIELSGISFVAADVNNDGKVSIADSVDILKYSVEIILFTDIGTVKQYKQN